MATFAIDPAHTRAGFSAKHMMITTVRGSFRDLAGTIEYDEADPTASRAEVILKAASIDTGFGARDTHLRGDDFFAAETYPEIRVVSTAIRSTGANEYVVSADVTIKDITNSVDFEVESLGFYLGMDGARRAGLTAKAKVNRKAWGLDWNVALEAGGLLVGDQIKLEVDLAIEEFAAVTDAAA